MVKKIRYAIHRSGELTDHLRKLIEDCQITIVKPDEFEDINPPAFILMSGMDSITTIATMYETVQSDVRVVALSQVHDIEEFLQNNGRLVVDASWYDYPAGRIFLEKFFLGQASVHLDMSVKGLQHQGSCKITNHLRMGNELDRICLAAFEHDFPLVNVRTFVDHTAYYLFYLKQSGLGMIPFDVDYGNTESEFFVQIHLPVKNYVAEYLLDSFGPINGHDPTRYLLGAANKSCDFMEVLYLKQNTKLVITGLWQRSEDANKPNFSGLSINHVQLSSQIIRNVELELEEFQVVDANLDLAKSTDLNEKPLPDNKFKGILPELPSAGYLKDHPQLSNQLVAFVIEQLRQQGNLQESLATLDEGTMAGLLAEYFDVDEVVKLERADIDSLITNIKKNSISHAYDSELERAREKIKQDSETQKVLNESYLETISEKLISDLTHEDIVNLVKGTSSSDDVAIILPSFAEDDPAIVVKGSSAKDHMISRVSGHVEDDVKNIIVSGQKMEVDDFIVRISTRLSDEVKGDMKVKSLLSGQQVPKRLRSALERFAGDKGIDLAKLSEDHFAEFSNKELPKFIGSMVSVDSDFSFEDFLDQQPEHQLKKKLQVSLASKLSSQFPQVSSDQMVNLITAEEQELLVKNLLKDSVKEIATSINPIEMGVLKDTQQDSPFVEQMSEILHKKKADVAQVLQDASEQIKRQETKKIIEKVFTEESPLAPHITAEQITANNDTATGILKNRLKLVEKENEQLKHSLKAATTEVKALHDAKKQLQTIDNKIAESKGAGHTVEQEDENTQQEQSEARVLSSKVIEKLELDQKISAHESKLLKESLDREQKMTSLARQAEQEIKKARLEMKQRETMMVQELEKANRAVRTRDIVVEKAKESLKMMAEKKEREIRDLNGRLSDLNHALMESQGNGNQAQLKALEQERNGLQRIVDRYKDKLEVMMNQRQKNDARATGDTEALRKVQMEKNRLENQMSGIRREFKKLQERWAKDQSVATQLKVENQRLEQELKQSINNGKVPVGVSIVNDKSMEGAHKEELSKLQGEVKEHQQRSAKYELTIRELENKITELTASMARTNSSAAGQAQLTKVNQLEGVVKKLTQDMGSANAQIAEFKKEIAKARAEKTALQNAIDKMKKEAERNKATAATKPAAKKAA